MNSKPTGRLKGQTKVVTIIRDDLFGKYEIHKEERCFNVVNTLNRQGVSYKSTEWYFVKLSHALLKIIELQMIETGKVVTLKEYINEYNTLINKFYEKFEM